MCIYDYHHWSHHQRRSVGVAALLCRKKTQSSPFEQHVITWSLVSCVSVYYVWKYMWETRKIKYGFFLFVFVWEHVIDSRSSLGGCFLYNSSVFDIANLLYATTRICLFHIHLYFVCICNTHCGWKTPLDDVVVVVAVLWLLAWICAPVFHLACENTQSFGHKKKQRWTARGDP